MDTQRPIHSISEYILSLPLATNYSTIRRHRRNELIFREGEAGDTCYVLLTGNVVAYRTSPVGLERILQFFQPEDIYGNITLAGGRVHTMTTETIGPATNLEIEIGYLRELCRQYPALMWHLYEDLAKKLQHVSRIMEATYLTAEQRIVQSLVDIAGNFGYRVPEGVEIRLDLTQDALARYSGTTRVTVAKVIASLVDRGVLRTRPKPWVILHMTDLMRQAET